MPSAETTNRRPVLLGLAAAAALTVLVVVGSRNLEHYDPALFGYTVASVVDFGALVYCYAVWLRRPLRRTRRSPPSSESDSRTALSATSASRRSAAASTPSSTCARTRLQTSPSSADAPS